MKVRALVLTALVSLASVFSIASAQDMGCPGGLAAADCAVISGATTNTLTTVTSFNQEWSIDFSVTGVPNGGDITFKSNGSGPVILDLASTTFPLSFDQKVTVDAAGGGQTIAGDTGAILKDGVLYLDFGGGTWMSVDLVKALADAQSGNSGLPINPADLMSGDNAAVNDAMAALPQLAALAEVPGFLTYTRDGDTFTFVADVAKLINDPSFATTVTELSKAAGEQGAQIAGMAGILPMVFQAGTITVVQTVDSASNVVTGLDFNVDATINAAMLDSSATDPVVLSLKFSVKLSDANGTFDITAPANAQPIPMGSGM